MDLTKLRKAIQANLSPDLLSSQYSKQYNNHFTTGHCYVATEAAFHILGGYDSDWGIRLIQRKHLQGETHWYLMNWKSSLIFDPTSEQFGHSYIPYERSTGGGFLTLQPSLRAVELIRRINLFA